MRERATGLVVAAEGEPVEVAAEAVAAEGVAVVAVAEPVVVAEPAVGLEPGGGGGVDAGGVTQGQQHFGSSAGQLPAPLEGRELHRERERVVRLGAC